MNESPQTTDTRADTLQDAPAEFTTGVVTVPYEYTQLYFENPRQRNHRERTVTENVPVTFQAPTGPAPLLCTGTGERVATGKRAEYRRIGKRTFIQEHLYDGRPANLASYIKQERLLTYGEQKAENSEVIGRKLSQALQERKVVVIEGVVYRESGEPVYSVSGTGSFTSVNIAHIWPGGEVTGIHHHNKENQLFRLDAYADALAFAQAHKEKYRLRQGNVNIGTPDMLFDQVNSALLTFGERFPFQIETTVSFKAVIQVEASDVFAAKALAHAALTDTYEVSSSDRRVRVETESSVRLDREGDTGLPKPMQLDLRGSTLLPEVTIGITDHVLKVTDGTEVAELAMDASVLRQEGAREAVIAACAVMLATDAAEAREWPLVERVAALDGVDAAQAMQIRAAFGSRAISAAHRAARGLLSPQTLAKLCQRIERALA